MKRPPERDRTPAPRFGIGEWYGRLYPALNAQERRDLAERHFAREKIACPFKPKVLGEPQACHKAGGVCSLKLYEAGEGGSGNPVEGEGGSLRTLCPSRFRQDGVIERWIGTELLGTETPLVIGEVGFLRTESASTSPETDAAAAEEPENVGRIDSVFMHPDLDRLHWCAVELQAVYFSGNEMGSDLKAAADWPAAPPPFPVKNRRPDYRSSGPKRLMPQLQIKVPTLRRWGKKMAVVVDQAFFSAFGSMDDVREPSNADIAWFVVRLAENGGKASLEPHDVRYTTLERAVEGLTTGRPVSLPEFENRIRRKLEDGQRTRERLLRTRANRDRG